MLSTVSCHIMKTPWSSFCPSSVHLQMQVLQGPSSNFLVMSTVVEIFTEDSSNCGPLCGSDWVCHVFPLHFNYHNKQYEMWVLAANWIGQKPVLYVYHNPQKMFRYAKMQFDLLLESPAAPFCGAPCRLASIQYTVRSRYLGLRTCKVWYPL